MNLYENELYMEDVQYVAELPLPWERMRDSSILISGATGMIGSFLVDVILEKNNYNGLNCKVYALIRDEAKAKQRFFKHLNSSHLVIIPFDVRNPLVFDNLGTIDFVCHFASNTHPIQYSTDPIGTITTNIIGLMNMLDFSVTHDSKRFAFASSNEIYGENRGDKDFFDEEYCGYIDSNSIRAGYPESKRCGEALCQAYMVQKNLSFVIPRFTRTYGPTMFMSDTKALSQFIKNGIKGEDIILKSSGTQFYSFQYVADSVAGFLFILLKGNDGEAYNIAEEHSDIMIKDLSAIVAEICNTKVISRIPNKVEAAGYSKVTKARLDGSKLINLGWKPKYDIRSGIERTIRIMKEC